MYKLLRQKMVERYVIGAGIKDPLVVAAMSKVDRHLFVEDALKHQAYIGSSLPIGYGQTISHPSTVALMSHILKIKMGDKILEIGTGSGYQAAVLCEMGARVFTIERIAELAHRAQRLFNQLQYYSIALKIGDGTLGWNEHAPYEGIIVTAGAPVVPDTLTNQLSEGGTLVIPVGDIKHQKLHIIQRQKGKLTMKEENWRHFVPLIGTKGW